MSRVRGNICSVLFVPNEAWQEKLLDEDEFGARPPVVYHDAQQDRWVPAADARVGPGRCALVLGWRGSHSSMGNARALDAAPISRAGKRRDPPRFIEPGILCAWANAQYLLDCEMGEVVLCTWAQEDRRKTYGKE